MTSKCVSVPFLMFGIFSASFLDRSSIVPRSFLDHPSFVLRSISVRSPFVLRFPNGERTEIERRTNGERTENERRMNGERTENVCYYCKSSSKRFKTTVAEISRLAASGITSERGDSITLSVTIMLRRTGKQCIKWASLVTAM